MQAIKYVNVTYSEYVLLLCVFLINSPHQYVYVHCTIDQLRGRLKRLNLKRRGDEIQTPLQVVSAAIMVTNSLFKLKRIN